MPKVESVTTCRGIRAPLDERSAHGASARGAQALCGAHLRPVGRGRRLPASRLDDGQSRQTVLVSRPPTLPYGQVRCRAAGGIGLRHRPHRRRQGHKPNGGAAVSVEQRHRTQCRLPQRIAFWARRDAPRRLQSRLTVRHVSLRRRAWESARHADPVQKDAELAHAEPIELRRRRVVVEGARGGRAMASLGPRSARPGPEARVSRARAKGAREVSAKGALEVWARGGLTSAQRALSSATTRPTVNPRGSGWSHVCHADGLGLARVADGRAAAWACWR